MSFLKANSAVPTSSAPSPTPSNSSANGTKRKRPADDVSSSTVFSQPRDTGTGTHIFTQVTYAIDFLKQDPERWVTLKEVLNYLNLPKDDLDNRQKIRQIFATGGHSRIEYDPAKNMYRYRPKHSVRNAEQLKGFLQNQKSAQGLAVKDLKDGWPSVQEAVAEMERKKELLVTHNKKDNSAKTVWINDPTLMHKVDPEFQNEWHKILLPPNDDDLRNKLIAANLKPASAPKEIVIAKPKERRKKAPRRGGKQTNTHMAAILKDYSHKRK